jgi:L-serine dehydratase
MIPSVFDLFKVGVGPSSSHTVGPLRAALLFVSRLDKAGLLASVDRVTCTLHGSLGATGRGHATDKAVVWGLHGENPETLDPDRAQALWQTVVASRSLELAGRRTIAFDVSADIVFAPSDALPFHPNALTLEAFGAAGPLDRRVYYSPGGGFVVDGEAAQAGFTPPKTASLPYPFTSAATLLGQCDRLGLSVSGLVLANESAARPTDQVKAGLLRLWAVMKTCLTRGLQQEGTLPGGLNVRRRAPRWYRKLVAEGARNADPLVALDWVELWALAVNEENAAGGRVVTAPTNGAAGIIPAVLKYYETFVPGANDDGVVRFLLAAGAVGMLFKRNGSISGAEVGCQGEVGSACSMAAAGLTEALGGTPAQVENAAEIAMEHNLGLTCDPIGGLVQVPCIERNALAAVKAISAARMALRGDGHHLVSLDRVIATMVATGRDMGANYKETARGGLAVNYTEC